MKVRMHNFMSHDETTVDLPDRGLVVVTGPNGSGKSAIVEAVAHALWGRATRGARWSGWRAVPGLVRIEGGGLVAERRWTGKGKALRWSTGSTPDHDTTSKAQEGLDAVVGPFDVWRRTCVFSSADAAHFTLASDAERKDVLEALLGLEWFERALAACRRDLHAARTSRAVADREAEVAASGGAAAARALAAARAVLDSVPAGDDALARARLARNQGHVRDVEGEVAGLRAKVQAAQVAGALDRATASHLRARLDKLSGDRCHACDQPVTVELRDRLRGEVDVLLAAADAERAAAAAEVASVAEDLAELEEQLRELRARVDWDRAQLAAADRTRQARDRAVDAVSRAELEVASYAEERAEAQARGARLAVDVAELAAVEQALGVRGVRARVVGSTLAAVEQLANVWLGRLSSRLGVRLRPYTERKSGALVDAISLTLVGAGGGDEGEYAGASAGERRRVDVALLMSLAELVSGSRAGATWRSPLFFDEAFDGLDDDGRDAVEEVVREVARDRCVVLITHDERLGGAAADLRLRVAGGVVS